MKREHLLATALMTVMAGARVLVACAESDDTASANDAGPSTVPSDSVIDAGEDATGISDASFSSADGDVVDAGCPADSQDPSCFVAKDCASADFCAEDVELDSRLALLAVRGSTKTNVWATGAGGTILHFDGTSWTNVPNDRTNTLRMIWVTSPTDVWFAGSGAAIWRGTGTVGADFTLASASINLKPTTDAPFTGISMSPDQSTLIVGGGFFVGVPGGLGSVFVRTGLNATPAWTAITPNTANTVIGALWGTGNDLWRVGPNGMAQRSTDFWSLTTTAMKTATWVKFDPQTTTELTAITGFGDSSVWMVGKNGIVRRYSGGVAPRFDIMQVPTSEDLYAIWGSSPNDVYVVGDKATILHWDGSTWSHASTFTPDHATPTLYGVWGSGGEVWAVGTGAILRLRHGGDTPGGVQ